MIQKNNYCDEKSRYKYEPETSCSGRQSQHGYITFKIVDKKVAKRTAIQEQVIVPLRAHNYLTVIGGKKTERCVSSRRFSTPR